MNLGHMGQLAVRLKAEQISRIVYGERWQSQLYFFHYGKKSNLVPRIFAEMIASTLALHHRSVCVSMLT